MMSKDTNDLATVMRVLTDLDALCADERDETTRAAIDVVRRKLGQFTWIGDDHHDQHEGRTRVRLRRDV